MSLFSYHALLVVESVTYHRPRSIDLGSYSRRVSSTVSAELADPAQPEPWTSPGAAAQRPPRLLLTLLGDYWWQRTEPLPSAAIVALLAEFGVSDSAARAALSRLTRNGLLVTSKTGRRTFSRLSSRAAGILDDGARRIFSFGAASQPWDGMWSLVAFSIPEDNRAARDALRKQLRWRGFAPLYDGLWVSPRDHAAEVIGYLKDLDITTGTAFRATSVPAECEIPAQAWDLEGLRAHDFPHRLHDSREHQRRFNERSPFCRRTRATRRTSSPIRSIAVNSSSTRSASDASGAPMSNIPRAGSPSTAPAR